MIYYLLISPLGTRLSTHKTGSEATWSNMFHIDSEFPPNRYEVSVSNDGGVAWYQMAFFLSAKDPIYKFINIEPSDPIVKSRLLVTDFGCCGTVDCDSTAAVQRAVQEANKRAASGEKVEIYFPRGVYYLGQTNAGMPPLYSNVSLRGEGMELVSIYFKEQQLKSQTPRFTNAPPAYVSFNGTGPNEVSDLTLYVTMFYNSVITVDADHSGFSMSQVRIRANAYHCMNGPHLVGRGDRIANYTWEQVGPVLVVHGSNFRIVDSDIYSSYNAIWTSGPGMCFLYTISIVDLYHIY